MNQLLALTLALFAVPALAIKPSFIGSEIQTKQTMGYGKYSISLKASEGVGSITGFFNLCYANDSYTECVNWNPDDAHHLEMDVEFTPTGDHLLLSKPWVNACLTDDCASKPLYEAPRTASASLKAVSFNTYPANNQLYSRLGIDPYTDFNTYTIEVLPNKITWAVNGDKVLTREVGAQNALRVMPQHWDKFNNLLLDKKIKFITNLWDGSQGGNGGFGGGPSIIQTPGTAEIQKMAYYPAECVNENCTISDEPSFLMDLISNTYIFNGQKQEGANFCPLFDKFFTKINRTDYPVYVNPNNVQCTEDKIILKYGAGG